MVTPAQQQRVLLMTSGPTLCMDDGAVRDAVALTSFKGLEEELPSSAKQQQQRASSNMPDGDAGIVSRTLNVMTSALHALPRRRVESTTYDAVVIVPEQRGNLGFVPSSSDDSKELIRGAVKLLRENGRLVVIGDEGGERAMLDGSAVRSMLVMLGLREVEVQGRIVRGVRAARKAAEEISVAGAKPTMAPVKWTVDADDDDLIDEEELLGAEGNAVGTVEAEKVPGSSSCGATAKKACANCTCGRAEGKVVKLTKEMIENPQSGGCGSCSLGDAFRCAGCPYRGLPAFKIGEKIELPGDFLLDDA